MSMILDALKRADQDSLGDARASSLQSPPVASAKLGLPPLWAGLIALLGLLVVLMGYSLLSREDSDAVAASRSSRAISPQIPAAQLNADSATIPELQPSDVERSALSSEPNPVLAASATVGSVADGVSLPLATAGLVNSISEESRGSDDGANAVVDLYRQRDADPSVTERAAPTMRAAVGIDTGSESVRQATEVAATADDGEPLTQNAEVPHPVLDESPVDLESVLRQAQAEWGESALLPHPTALLESLSQQTKDRIPSVIYSVHDWQSAGRSTVVINGKRLGTGQREGGFLVREILEDSVILSWGGTDFRLRALNSWINL